MRTNTQKTATVAFIIDGYFGFKLYKHAKGSCGKTIDFEELVDSTCKILGDTIGQKCVSPANLRQYYMGKDSSRVNCECNEYENALQLARFGARSRPLQGGREKAIDTLLYSDVRNLADSGIIDYLVLLAGDLDHINLVKDLKDMGIGTLLLYGEIGKGRAKTTGCSPELRRACFYSIDLFNLIQKRQGNRRSISMSRSQGGTCTMSADRGRPPVPCNIPMDNSSLLQKVVAAVNQVISDGEQAKGTHLVFALQSQVGVRLKRDGVILPVSLGEYLGWYPTVFRVGTHPRTQALTVSINHNRKNVRKSFSAGKMW